MFVECVLTVWVCTVKRSVWGIGGVSTCTEFKTKKNMTDKEKIEHLTNTILSVREQIKEDYKDLKLIDNKHYGWEEYDTNHRLNNLYKLTKPINK